MPRWRPCAVLSVISRRLKSHSGWHDSLSTGINGQRWVAGCVRFQCHGGRRRVRRRPVTATVAAVGPTAAARSRTDLDLRHSSIATVTGNPTVTVTVTVARRRNLTARHHDSDAEPGAGPLGPDSPVAPSRANFGMRRINQSIARTPPRCASSLWRPSPSPQGLGILTRKESLNVTRKDLPARIS
jgi:hypothetical protein